MASHIYTFILYIYNSWICTGRTKQLVSMSSPKKSRVVGFWENEVEVEWYQARPLPLQNLNRNTIDKEIAQSNEMALKS